MLLTFRPSFTVEGRGYYKAGRDAWPMVVVAATRRGLICWAGSWAEPRLAGLASVVPVRSMIWIWYVL
jgi:hypothetical protein